jgi:segregation and condensation protein A
MQSGKEKAHPANPGSGGESEERQVYRIELDIYSGPLDLLLYLVYRNEVDIFNIPISEILEHYLAYVEVIKELDIEIAGDFMVMASRLMNIKSRLLMPGPQAEPQDEEIIDPRVELVKELLEYKEYKERAYALEQKKLERDRMFERVPAKGENGLEGEVVSPEFAEEDVNVWDLLIAFHGVTKDFMPDVPRKIVHDDTPVAVYVERLIGKVSAAPGHKLTFSELFGGRRQRMKLIGMFLALLEAAKQGALRACQVQDHGEIYIELVPGDEREGSRGPGPAGVGNEQ